MSIEILPPDGSVGEAERAAAPPPAVLSGLAIGVLDNTKPNADVLLDRLAAGLAERTGAVVGSRWTKNAALAADDLVLQGMTDEVRIVLTGSAD